jgi:hypothetical protein
MWSSINGEARGSQVVVTDVFVDRDVCSESSSCTSMDAPWKISFVRAPALGAPDITWPTPKHLAVPRLCGMLQATGRQRNLSDPTARERNTAAWGTNNRDTKTGLLELWVSHTYGRC